MTDDQRIETAMEYARMIRSHLIAATEAADPVEIRRQLVRAAQKHRQAANLLDDNGRLTE